MDFIYPEFYETSIWLFKSLKYLFKWGDNKLALKLNLSAHILSSSSFKVTKFHYLNIEYPIETHIHIHQFVDLAAFADVELLSQIRVNLRATLRTIKIESYYVQTKLGINLSSDNASYLYSELISVNFLCS